MTHWNRLQFGTGLNGQLLVLRTWHSLSIHLAGESWTLVVLLCQLRVFTKTNASVSSSMNSYIWFSPSLNLVKWESPCTVYFWEKFHEVITIWSTILFVTMTLDVTSRISKSVIGTVMLFFISFVYIAASTGHQVWYHEKVYCWMNYILDV